VTGRPLPATDAQSMDYWKAASEGVLTVARCRHCRTSTVPPDQTCEHCGSTDPQ